MRLVDRLYRNNLIDILNSDKEMVSRAKWKDINENASTKSNLHYFVAYKNVDKDFPIINFRKIYYKSAIKEALWIYRDRSNKLKDLGLSIWDSWDYKNTGTIGNVYGFVSNKLYPSLENKYPKVFGDKLYLNQVEYLFQTLIDNPNDRRMMINLYDLDEVHQSNLPPCAFLTMWNVKNNELYMNLTQRSGDFLVASGAGNFNEVQYAFLLCLVAKCCGYGVGDFSHFVMDSHIYDRHWKDNNLDEYINQSLISNSEVELVIKVKYDISKYETKEEKLFYAWKNFMEFTENDYELLGYEPNDYKLKLEVAV